MTTGGTIPRILHCLPAFDDGPTARRLVRVINGLGRRVEHAIVMDDPSRRAAAALIDRRARVSWPSFPPLVGRRLPRRLMRLAAAMEGYDLVCTYGHGALDVACAHTLFADVYKLPPFVHHEDGSGDASDNGGGARSLRKRRGTFYLRIALGRAAAVVVTTPALERTAIEAWQQPRGRVRRIADGVDTAAFARKPPRDALAGLVKRRDERWIGAIVDPRAGTPALSALVQACRTLPDEWQLVVAGDDAARAAAIAEAERLGIDDRVHATDASAPRPALLGLLDILALPDAGAEASPMLFVEAMAAGLPVVAPRGGEGSAVLASENGPLLTPDAASERTAEPVSTLAGALAEMLGRLAGDEVMRRRIGEANRAKARQEHDAAHMVERIRALYWNLMGRQ